MVLLQTIIPTDSVAVTPESNLSFGQLLKDGQYQQIVDNMLTWGIDLLMNILIAVVLFVIGRFLILKIDGFVGKVMRKSSWDVVLKGFLRSVIQGFLFVVLFMIIINTVGVKTVSIAAIIGAAGLAIGLAMKDNLANFAGGVMILLSKPFRGGDFIRAQNLEGTVESIGILHTILRTADNKTIYIPNGPLSTGTIINDNSIDGILRTEVVVNVDYGNDIEKVKELMLALADEHSLVVKHPKPFARMTKINNNSLEFTFRVWARKSDLSRVKHDLGESVYRKLHENGMITPK
jgi:small conductance mechanosensitive channel